MLFAKEPHEHGKRAGFPATRLKTAEPLYTVQMHETPQHL